MRREAFPIFRAHPELIYLDSAATTHKPQCVIDALSSFYANEYATVHRAIYRPSLLATEKYNATRQTIASFLRASSPDEIVFTRGTTDALNLVAHSYGKAMLKPGDEILVSQMEHHSNIVPWQMIAKETGAHLKWIPMDASGVLDWHSSITAKTKIVAVAHVSNVTGTLNPIAEIAKAAHAVGAVIVVDGAQAAPHMPVDVQLLDADFYAFSGHKCYGPTGVGALYGKKELLLQMPPIQGGGDMIDEVRFEESSYQLPPLRFEAGTPLIGPVIALKSALDFIDEVGKENISKHEMALCEQVLHGLKQIDGLRLLGQAPQRGPLISFVIDGIHPLDLATLLDLKHIAIRSGHLCAQPVLRVFGVRAVARVSFGMYNTMQEGELFLKELHSLVSQLRSKRVSSI